MIKEILLVGLGGAAGSILRYLGTILTNKWIHTHYPLGTPAVNLIGCFLIGMLLGMAEHQQTLSANGRLLLATGFCGGFTTFSTFSAESLALFENGNIAAAGLYITLSVSTGLLAVWFGVSLLR
jgi:CrcB protein